MTDPEETKTVAAPAPDGRLAQLADVGLHTASLLHELRQPLFAVQAAAELGMLDGADARAALGHVLGHLGHVRDLVERYAGLGRSDEPERTLDLREPVIAALAMLEHRARRVGAALVSDTPVAAGVVGRESELRQVALNLVQNALDAVERSTTRQVSVRVFQDGQEAVLEVRDSGAGIPDALLAHVFEPFVSGKPAGTGTGLGLYITHAIVASTRGRVAIRSDADGATVVVRWPLV